MNSAYLLLRLNLTWYLQTSALRELQDIFQHDHKKSCRLYSIELVNFQAAVEAGHVPIICSIATNYFPTLVEMLNVFQSNTI